MKNIALFLAAAVLAVTSTAFAGPGDWQWLKTVDAPPVNGVPTIGVQRLEARDDGRVYLSVNAGAPHEYIFVTDDITVPTTYTMLLQDAGMANGFQGLTFDDAGNLYIAGESGAVGTGTLRKYDSADTLVTDFGTSGVVTPSNRITGISTLSNGDILGTTFGGHFYTYDPITGAESDEDTTPTFLGNFVRDINVKQDDVDGTDEIFANKSGSLFRVTGGSATNVTGYTTFETWHAGVTPSDSSFQVRAGVEYFPTDDTVIFTNQADHQAHVVDASTGTVIQTLGSGTQGTAEGNLSAPGDAAVYTIGTQDYLVISNSQGLVTIYSKTNATAVEDWMLMDE